ncbi:hypothetical protein C343_05002 [Cryptococcus neoformans C23]|uniref:Uncharacterized protein n=1 Tax=Cryptococcus neoformans (strain H99 / ATCC 208821 / CBS 10515 / FGSC 9487) TaxID=235443 RepID=J9VYT8_CRYN9|nr:hypothetical protein CNAG_07759 [Cryptococcus neoformans var. grubii H99]AUB26839.1 hypothetical protein CKF44_07759 [Cryptococcus neoformans var. grubii]OWZ41047.1 hypothetical protein C343_05002 [Cryptococcus neoformans var. grubii C23]OXC83029.1 hypothetical protein C344_04730 [Cryptococcus neoformans var. grubii AD1-7a]AFR96875.1 hypothetical protein CNAG_07759 [Cryptococcus neoformans var. grubii H99]OXH28191.1 hypothetical protein J005_04857 [Cryptococcus neoformans var. grubii]|eukprot:XP_012051877.1 hypothetical protein CNAG_07759 [Cryptococcus neoformans var. grubii H99]
MSSMTEEKSATVTASSNEVSVTSSTWVQEVSDTAKGLKDWEIALIGVLLAIGAIALLYFVIRCARKRHNKDVQPSGLDVSKV